MHCIGAVVVVLTGYRRDVGEGTKRQYRTMPVGVAILPAYGVIGVTANILEVSRPPILSMAVLSTGMVFAVALFKHGLFVIEPAREEMLMGIGGSPSPAGGRCILVVGKKEGMAYRMMVDALASGSQGMLISRICPDRVRERFGLTKTPIIWLSTLPGPDRIDPLSLSVLRRTIVDFLRRSSGSVVLLDGLECLLSYNRTEKVIRLVCDIRDAAAVSGSKLIVPVDPKVFEARSFAHPEREIDVVMPEDLPARAGEDA